MITNSRAKGGADWRFDSLEGCSCDRGSGDPFWRGFFLEWPVKDAPQLLSVNKFAILHIESVNTSNSGPKDTSPPSSTPIINILLWKPKWEKQLPKQLSANALNTYRMFLILSVEVSMTDTSELYSVKVLLDYGATSSSMDQDFVHSKEIKT